MTRLFWQSLLAAPVAIGAALVSTNAIAVQAASIDATGFKAASPESTTSVSASEAVPPEDIPGVNPLEQEPVQLAQITSVSQLSDVLPSDWAYQALQSLVEQYGCIQGYPDRTFRGNSPLTRYEFAAGLNACLDVLTQLGSNSLDPDDLATIRRLQEEFQAELNTLRGRVDALEADVAELEANQFSTTTTFRGQVDFHLGAPLDPYISSVGPETSPTFNSRAMLDFNTSFSGEDLLFVRLQATSGGQPFTDFRGFKEASGLAPGASTLDVVLEDLFYRFPVGDRLDITLAGTGLNSDEYVRTITPFAYSVADAGNPQYLDIGMGGGAGVGISFAFAENLVLDAGYTVNTTGSADPAIGIFQGSSTGGGQSYGASLSYIPEGFLNLSVTYLHGDGANAFAGGPTFGGAVDTFGGQVALDFGGFTVSGYGAYTTFSGGNDFNWLAGIAFNDLFMEGSQLGIYAGQLPQRAVNITGNPFVVEGYYHIPFNQFLSITPAIIYGDANNGSTDDSTIYGAIRTTFRF
ncbi:MAG TPA: iron uptake porin [Leptolyngbyaceae cyanobacterium]